MRKVLSIEGMSCGHCVMRVKSAIEDVAGVRTVQVDLLKKSAMIEGDGLDDTALRIAVSKAGYRVISVLG